MNSIVKNLGQIKNMKTVTLHLRKGISNGSSKAGGIKSGVWSSLRSVRSPECWRALLTCAVCFPYSTDKRCFEGRQWRRQTRNSCKSLLNISGLHRDTDPICQVFEKFDTHNIANVGRMISEIVNHPASSSLQFLTDIKDKIDFAASSEMHRTVIKSGVDNELDTMKRTYDGLDDLLNRISEDIAATIPSVYSLKLNVIFFPQIGFLISVQLNPDTDRGDYEGGEREDQRWTRIFSTEEWVYYKDSRMKELDDTFGDMYSVVCGTLR